MNAAKHFHLRQVLWAHTTLSKQRCVEELPVRHTCVVAVVQSEHGGFRADVKHADEVESRGERDGGGLLFGVGEGGVEDGEDGRRVVVEKELHACGAIGVEGKEP